MLQDKNIVSTANIFGLYIPLLIILIGIIFFSTVTEEEINTNFKYVSYLITAICGAAISNAVRLITITSKFEKYSESQSSFMLEIKNEIDNTKRSNRILSTLTSNDDLDFVEEYSKWLTANQDFSKRNPILIEFSNWQKEQVNLFLRNKTRECREQELLIDDPVKELVSNTTLLTTIPKEEVIAISFEDTPFWNSNEGIKFLEAHKSVLEKGVVISRIFVIQSEEESSLIDVMNKQVEAGIDVYKVELSLAKHLNPEDCVIYDKILVRKGISDDSSSEMFKKAKLISTPSVISREYEKSKALISIAQKWKRHSK